MTKLDFPTLNFTPVSLFKVKETEDETEEKKNDIQSVKKDLYWQTQLMVIPKNMGLKFGRMVDVICSLHANYEKTMTGSSILAFSVKRCGKRSICFDLLVTTSLLTEIEIVLRKALPTPYIHTYL